MNRSEAQRLAFRESHMYRQGTGWIVTFWDGKMGVWLLTHEMPWEEARRSLSSWRKDRREELRSGVNSNA